MVKKTFSYHGKSLEELQQMSYGDFAKLAPANVRRKIKRGFTEEQKKLLERVKNKKNVETHVRDMIILPEMVGKIIKVYNGKQFVPVDIMPEMICHALGEFVLTRKRLTHSAPGVGATRSSASISVK